MSPLAEDHDVQINYLVQHRLLLPYFHHESNQDIVVQFHAESHTLDQMEHVEL